MMKKTTPTRALAGAFLIVAVSAAVSGCSSSSDDRLRSENTVLMERLAAAEAAREAASAAEQAAEAARIEAERAAEAAALAQARAEAEHDVAVAEAEAARERAAAAAEALAVAEAERDAALARAEAAAAALEELLAGIGGGPIAWGPPLAGSNLSALSGTEDEFGPKVADALVRAARALPNGGSQSSLVDERGRTADEMSVQVIRDEDGNLVYEMTDGARIALRAPFGLPRQGFDLALFSDLIPGIEPDLSSYPHDVLGIWAWDVDVGEVGVFWGRSPSIPGVSPTGISPTGAATYEGDAVGLHGSAGATTKFLADVELVADFDVLTVGGVVDGFRTLEGQALGDLR